MNVLNPGEHGSTFGGNPLACAVARAALGVLVKEKMVENSAEMGEYFLNGLKKLKNPLIKEVRGRGLMIGLEFIPEKINARTYCESLKDNGLLCKETHKNIIRFAPPLVATKEDIDYALDIIQGVIG
jgi:ornithine--oxo-acid transaminase